MALTKFTDGQRVTVFAIFASGRMGADPGEAFGPVGIPGGAAGTVRRIRKDGGAWVELDTRRSNEEHPFPADDPTRAAHVLTDPGLCGPPKAAAVYEVQTFDGVDWVSIGPAFHTEDIARAAIVKAREAAPREGAKRYRIVWDEARVVFEAPT